MSNILLPTPDNIDFFFQRLQTRLYYDVAQNVWGVNDTNFNAYGRVYRNKTTDGYIPEFYSPTKQTYMSGANIAKGGMFFEMGLAGYFYFYLTDSVKKMDNGDSLAKAQLLFFVDLSKINPGGITDKSQRLDDIAINDVRDFIQYNGCGFVVKDTFRNVDKVLESFSGSVKRDSLNDDMHPRLCFRLDLELRYNASAYASQKANPVPIMYKTRSIVLFIKNSPDNSKTIAVGGGQFIQEEYAPTDILSPQLITASNSYLAGKDILYMGYNNNPDALANYNTTTGKWDRTASAVSPLLGFNEPDFVQIIFRDIY